MDHGQRATAFATTHFEMNAARMKKCMDAGRTREQCMREVYPDQAKKKSGGKKNGNKTPTKPDRAPRGKREYT